MESSSKGIRVNFTTLSLIAISEWTLLGMSNYGVPGGPTGRRQKDQIRDKIFRLMPFLLRFPVLEFLEYTRDSKRE
jgi:hypothetical protein